MNSVFLLWYVKAPDSDDEEEFLIGVYDQEGETKDAIERLKDKPGFVDAPDEFHIHRYEVNPDHRTEDFISPD